ncbi:hypothetical protein [Actinoplanes siamensis]|uniref:Uncharacterized protein n=1 Tax=Actinoplanes siamensis TaxID=1223317 RepID=A0A919N490_9ACTN|nr:hypothetical protein [Actinoplanes siamensis]GIF04098.1 hypothetical protein Asi03nite_16360 [Actinoplanes siamensis]
MPQIGGALGTSVLISVVSGRVDGTPPGSPTDAGAPAAALVSGAFRLLVGPGPGAPRRTDRGAAQPGRFRAELRDMRRLGVDLGGNVKIMPAPHGHRCGAGRRRDRRGGAHHTAGRGRLDDQAGRCLTNLVGGFRH